MDKIEITTSALASALNITPDQVAELVKNGDELVENYNEIIEGKFNERVKTVREAAIKKEKEARENLINKAVADNADKIERTYRETFSLSEDLKGEELTARMRELLDAAKSDIPEDKIKSSDIYQQAILEAEKRAKESLTDELKEWKSKYSTLQETTSREKLNNKIHRKGMELWAANEAEIMDMPEEVKANLLRTYLQKLEGHPFKELDGQLVLVDDEGNLKEDDLGNRLDARTLIDREFKGLIPLKKQGKRDSTGDKTDFGGLSFSFGKTPDEFQKNYQDKFDEIKAMPQLTAEERATKNAAFKGLEQVRNKAKEKNLI